MAVGKPAPESVQEPVSIAASESTKVGKPGPKSLGRKLVFLTGDNLYMFSPIEQGVFISLGMGGDGEYETLIEYIDAIRAGGFKDGVEHGAHKMKQNLRSIMGRVWLGLKDDVWEKCENLTAEKVAAECVDPELEIKNV